jgi:hypothetical protein
MYQSLIWQFIAGFILLLQSASALADADPNDNYSNLVLSYQNATFANKVCINNECHTQVSGPAALFSQQVVPNLALGLSGSYLQSSGRISSVGSTHLSAFAEALAGAGPAVDVGASFALLNSSLRLCDTVNNNCTSYDDSGNDVGVFGKVFLNDSRSVSLTLAYDAISWHQSQNQSVETLSLVSIFAKHHRFALSVDRVQDSSGNPVSSSAGLGYSFLVF